MRSLTGFYILEDMFDGLLDVARHLGVSGGFSVQAVEFVRLEQIVQRKCRATRT